MRILTLPITGPIGPLTSPVFQFQSKAVGQPRSVTVQANFVYGSGGTSADAYLQTSLDGGASWNDVANFHFLLASARKIANLSSGTSITTLATGSDGTLTANTCVDGIIGTLWRVKYVIVGTYAGGTSLNIDMLSSVGLTPQ